MRVKLHPERLEMRGRELRLEMSGGDFAFPEAAVIVERVVQPHEYPVLPPRRDHECREAAPEEIDHLDGATGRRRARVMNAREVLQRICRRNLDERQRHHDGEVPRDVRSRGGRPERLTAGGPEQHWRQSQPWYPVECLEPERVEPVDWLVAHDVSQGVLRHEDEACSPPYPGPAEQCPHPTSGVR